ncbi:MAG: hydantoinase/oxoprolinase family protein [Pseudomonadota bacterium]
MDQMDYRLGVDIGGTFTDVVLEGGSTRISTKVLTTYNAPEDAIVLGLNDVCAKAGIAPSDLTQIIHGTTLATNALIERRGAKTALITTRGFRDVIEMRTESRFEQYDLNLTLPAPLLARDDRHVVTERMDAQGRVLIPLEAAEVKDLVETIKSKGYESVAIGLLHSYANDAHEVAVAEALSAALPNLSISVSSEVSPQMREYERFNTTIANAYIKPLMASYLGRLKERLSHEGAVCPVFLMHSGGGIMSVESAQAFPVRLVESGPAGGAIFAAHVAARHGLDRVLSFDMGGTTAKICLIRDQSPKTARVFEVARSYRFKKGSGMPISIPVIDMVEIGAGGGSIASVDDLRQIRVGPESAGSEPGPACYGRGGTRPAVTDADLVLGKLDPDHFAGGSISLDIAKSREALSTEIGTPLDLDEEQAAWGVAEVVDETMANAARVHAVENGEDLGDYAMIAFGGAAPLHAARLCQKLGISRCLIPEGAGVGSAIGFLRAPFSFEASRSRFMRLMDVEGTLVASLFDEMTDEAARFVRTCAPNAPLRSERKAFMRYEGQGWDVPVELPEGAIDRNLLLDRFEAVYAALFGRVVDGLEIEITVWSVNVSTEPDAVARAEPSPKSSKVAGQGARPLFDPVAGTVSQAAVVPRSGLVPGAMLAGPALVTEDETTVIVPEGRAVRALSDGTLDVVVSADTTEIFPVAEDLGVD